MDDKSREDGPKDGDDKRLEDQEDMVSGEEDAGKDRRADDIVDRLSERLFVRLGQVPEHVIQGTREC